jgi:hypothetical protein
MKWLSGKIIHSEQEGQRLAILFSYDPDRRLETARLLLAAGVETHYRIPIDRSDVETASCGSGLVLRDWFTNASLLSRRRRGLQIFCVLQHDG